MNSLPFKFTRTRTQPAADAISRWTPRKAALGNTFGVAFKTFALAALVAACAAAVLALAGCSRVGATAPATTASSPGAGTVKAAAVRVEQVKSAPLALGFALTGTVDAGRIAQLASAAEGPVQTLRVHEGDTVARGQVLLTLGRSEAASALVDSLRADLRKEDDNAERTRRLVDIGALPREQLDTVLANDTRIRSQLTKAQESVRDYVLTAPWAGMVSKLKVREGDVVAPRTPLVEIIDPASLLVRVAVPEEEAARLTLGMSAQVTLDAWPQQRFAARVTRLYPTLDVRTHTRLAELTLASPPLLLPGMFARVNVVRETLADAITVPAHALVAAPGGGASVFVVADGKAQRRKVTTGAEVEGRTLVTAGLKAGDTLIVAGQEALKEGAAVKAVAAVAKPATPASAATAAASAGARS